MITATLAAALMCFELTLLSPIEETQACIDAAGYNDFDVYANFEKIWCETDNECIRASERIFIVWYLTRKD